MPKEVFDGTINGKPVKVIITTKKSGEKMYLAKPKHLDTETPHFYDNHGILSVHIDSPNGKCFRTMIPKYIGSGSHQAGINFIENSGSDMVILPMSQDSDNFIIDTTSSGSYVTVPSGPQYYLYAFGTLNPWQRKPSTNNQH